MTVTDEHAAKWYAIIIGERGVVRHMSSEEAQRLYDSGYPEMKAFDTKVEAEAQANSWSASIADALGSRSGF